MLRKQPTLKARGIRYSNEQWSYLGKRAAQENKKNPEGGVTTASDVARHAVDKLIEADMSQI